MKTAPSVEGKRCPKTPLRSHDGRRLTLGHMSPANFEFRRTAKTRMSTPCRNHGLPTVGVRLASATRPADILASAVADRVEIKLSTLRKMNASRF